MKEFIVKKYTDSQYNLWNDFVSKAKNATFLFNRNFMDYHSDRFVDYSLVVLNGEKLVAVLPANLLGNALHSHQGLTYGGLLYSDREKLATIISIFKVILIFLDENQIKHLFIKTIPNIYHQKPADELLYALFLVNSQLIKRDSLSVIDLRKSVKYAKNKKRDVTKGFKKNLIINEVDDFELFWNKILIPKMLHKYNSKPTHSLSEISLLKKLFPKNIRQFNVYDGNDIVAGTTIFESKTVAHSQYIFGDDNKNKNGSLDFLYNYLISNVFNDKSYLDFGSSNGYLGNQLNVNLSYWKESFGASTIVQDFYKVKTQNSKKLTLF